MLELDLVADSLIYRGQVVRQVLVDGKLAGGELEVRQAIALLPGSSDLAISGRMTTPEGRPHLKASLEAASGNLRALLGWRPSGLVAVPCSDVIPKILADEAHRLPMVVPLPAPSLGFAKSVADSPPPCAGG